MPSESNILHLIFEALSANSKIQKNAIFETRENKILSEAMSNALRNSLLLPNLPSPENAEWRTELGRLYGVDFSKPKLDLNDVWALVIGVLVHNNDELRTTEFAKKIVECAPLFSKGLKKRKLIDRNGVIDNTALDKLLASKDYIDKLSKWKDLPPNTVWNKIITILDATLFITAFIPGILKFNPNLLISIPATLISLVARSAPTLPYIGSVHPVALLGRLITKYLPQNRVSNKNILNGLATLAILNELKNNQAKKLPDDIIHDADKLVYKRQNSSEAVFQYLAYHDIPDDCNIRIKDSSGRNVDYIVKNLLNKDGIICTAYIPKNMPPHQEVKIAFRGLHNFDSLVFNTEHENAATNLLQSDYQDILSKINGLLRLQDPKHIQLDIGGHSMGGALAQSFTHYLIKTKLSTEDFTNSEIDRKLDIQLDKQIKYEKSYDYDRSWDADKRKENLKYSIEHFRGPRSSNILKQIDNINLHTFNSPGVSLESRHAFCDGLNYLKNDNPELKFNAYVSMVDGDPAQQAGESSILTALNENSATVEIVKIKTSADSKSSAREAQNYITLQSLDAAIVFKTGISLIDTLKGASKLHGFSFISKILKYADTNEVIEKSKKYMNDSHQKAHFQEGELPDYKLFKNDNAAHIKEQVREQEIKAVESSLVFKLVRYTFNNMLKAIKSGAKVADDLKGKIIIIARALNNPAFRAINRFFFAENMATLEDQSPISAPPPRPPNPRSRSGS